jgi:hypothetical protein
MDYILNLSETKRQEYIKLGCSPEQARNKLHHWMQNHTDKQKKVFQRCGINYSYKRYVPFLDSGCEKWYIDINYNTNNCYLYHKNREDETYHFQKEFNEGHFVTDNLIEICNYIWGHSHMHIKRDFNNTLRNKLFQNNISEDLIACDGK